MKEITTSTYSFEDLIEGGWMYVDKTEYIYELVRKPCGKYLMCRPRRFGKSLTVSLLESFFNGDRRLFRGLSIDFKECKWKKYPVVHIDFANILTKSLDEESKDLFNTICRIGKKYGIKIECTTSLNAFNELIVKLNKKYGNGVVILVDEYDKSVSDHIEDAECVKSFHSFLDSFYNVILENEKLLRFVYMTGVTRLSGLSILDTLDDITLDASYSCMMGYTQKEFEENFSEYIDRTIHEGAYTFSGENLHFEKEVFLKKFGEMYHGYRFAPGMQQVYNPVSIGKFFNNGGVFANYWFSTGNPSLIFKLLSKSMMTIFDVLDSSMSHFSYDTFDLTTLDNAVVDRDKIYQLLFQSGYLTIGETVQGTNVIPLKFPNEEIGKSFFKHFFNFYVSKNPDVLSTNLRSAASNGDTSTMISILETVLSSVPYGIHMNEEKYYQSLVYVTFVLSGVRISSEEQTNIGRIDGVLEAGKHIYVIEFKLGKSADKAMKQILDRKYTQKFEYSAKMDGITIHRLAINFSYGKDSRNITDWKDEIV